MLGMYLSSIFYCRGSLTKIFIQNFKDALSSNGSLPASGCTSGSFISEGYSKLLGLFIASASVKAGSGLRVYQSSDYGANWDYYQDFVPSACSGCAISVDLYGDAVKIEYRTDSAVSVYRMAWHLRPV